ncbi:MAG: biotin/lipoyl-binding protein [Chloroflexi bacterium]|nr:biotin/lipoyl-binding protein [Chloroflexota bacterium]
MGVEQAGPLQIQAPMPGVVNEVYVQPEQAVERGERLLVLEAMKMNNEIQAPRAGTVQEVRVTKGQRVNKGDLLLVLT